MDLQGYLCIKNYIKIYIVKEIYKEKFSKLIPIDLPNHSENNIISKTSRLIIDNSKLKDMGYTFKTNYKKHIHDLINFIKQFQKLNQKI